MTLLIYLKNLVLYKNRAYLSHRKRRRWNGSVNEEKERFLWSQIDSFSLKKTQEFFKWSIKYLMINKNWATVNSVGTKYFFLSTSATRAFGLFSTITWRCVRIMQFNYWKCVIRCLFVNGSKGQREALFHALSIVSLYRCFCKIKIKNLTARIENGTYQALFPDISV